MARIQVTHFGDPGCPWGYSANPALTALMWRYGEQLEWSHRLIGLTETASQYEARGYTAEGLAAGLAFFRRFGMPFGEAPAGGGRLAGTSPGCRAVVAVRRAAPERQHAAFRALQFMQFCAPGYLDEPDSIAAALEGVEGVDAAAAVAALEDDAVWADYEADRAAARTAEGGPGHAQGKTANTDGAERFTAPSLIFTGSDGRRLEAAGFQSLAVYDAMLANLDPTLERRPAPAEVVELVRAFPDGLTTAEVAVVYAEATGAEPDFPAARERLEAAVADGLARRAPLGDDALWLPA